LKILKIKNTAIGALNIVIILNIFSQYKEGAVMKLQKKEFDFILVGSGPGGATAEQMGDIDLQ
jgi:hypothetical protein